jgi:hypothetical protein
MTERRSTYLFNIINVIGGDPASEPKEHARTTRGEFQPKHFHASPAGE